MAPIGSKGGTQPSSGALPKQIRVTIDVIDAKGKDKRFKAEEAIPSAA